MGLEPRPPPPPPPRPPPPRLLLLLLLSGLGRRGSGATAIRCTRMGFSSFNAVWPPPPPSFRVGLLALLLFLLVLLLKDRGSRCSRCSRCSLCSRGPRCPDGAAVSFNTVELLNEASEKHPNYSATPRTDTFLTPISSYMSLQKFGWNKFAQLSLEQKPI